MSYRVATINARGLATRGRSLAICHLLRQHHVDIAFVQETNAFHLGSGQDLCLGYNAVVLAHPVAISGSGLACVFGPGVAVIQQRVLWPGHIALATIDVHGEEMTAIVVHLAHEPRERNRQLELLAATAAQEEEGACWIIGDFNIRDRGPSSSSSSDALAALLDLAALVDVATQFDAAHLPTRVAMHGDQVESNRLDRILVPAGVLDRVSIYATSHYHLSDHRLVLLQVGPPTTAVSSPTQPRLAAMLRSGLALEHLAGYIRELEEDAAHDDDDGTFWDRWTSIKAGLLAEARSLHDPRHAASDSYVYRARRYIAAQLEASSIRADYPSLPDLARAIRLRRPVSVIRDDEDNVIEGPELRRRAFATFRPRFARPTTDPAAGAAFIASSAPTTTCELSEEDPLHRPDISPSEIANAIEHLPRGKAPGWDGLPCELLVAFNEDFFAEALARVFAASRLRGALPPSTRHSSICLVPKARGGVLAAILHRRLKPHLRTLVPECQTYAVPGRSPSWNIAKVTDAVEEATAMGSPLAVMGIDLESAFDSLDRGFLESLMTSLRLPPAFMGWINILYAGADATIRAGGFHTTAFPLLNGLRQGCAVSAALFSIATGPLLRRLELTLGVGNVIAYADDIVLLFHRDEEFERVATVLEDFKRASGIAVNLGKSAGLWCGAWRNRGDSPLGASWSTTSIRVLGLDIAPRSSVVHQEQHLLALLESACRRWTPFTRGLSLVGRARAANSLVGSTIQHHLHGYLPSPPTIAKLQARLARFVWGPEHTAWLPAAVMARPVATGGLGLLDLATQLQLACLKRVQVALRGGRNAFSWLVESGEAWIHPPPDGTRLQPRRLRLLKLWEEASNILSLNHRALPTAQLLELPIIGGCRFLRPPDLLAPARWSGARVRDLIEEEHFIARPTRSALTDAAALGAFCRRLTSENAVGFGAESAPSSGSLAAAVVLQGTATPFLNGLTTRSARRALDRPRLAATPISRFTSRWSPTIGPPPSRIDWASLRRCAHSGHEADAALKLALHALPHPAHPASVGPSCPACGSIDRSLGHRYWCCRSIRPLIREAFNIIGRPPDLQAWIFGGSGLEDDALSILASAKLRIYRYFVQVGLGEAVEDPLIAWSRKMVRQNNEESFISWRSLKTIPAGVLFELQKDTSRSAEEVYKSIVPKDKGSYESYTQKTLSLYHQVLAGVSHLKTKMVLVDGSLRHTCDIYCLGMEADAEEPGVQIQGHFAGDEHLSEQGSHGSATPISVGQRPVAGPTGGTVGTPRVKMPKGVSNVTLAESPERAAHEPERLSSKSSTSAEMSAKIAFQKNSEENQEKTKHANPPAGDVHVNPAAARDVTAPPTAASSSAATPSPASLNWADSEMVDVDDNEGFTVVKNKKRRRTSTTPERAAKQPSRPAEKPSSQQLRRPTGPRTVPPREIKATRANIADAKQRQATTNHEHYIFVERCPEIPDYTYLKAMSRLVGGPDKITHFGKMNGHFLVGLATKDLARLLVESDLEIGGTTLRVFPYRKRAERIVVAGLPGFVDDFTIVNALGQYGRVTSIAPILIKLGEFAFNDGRREAFILLHEGVRLETLPTRLTIQSKGDTLSAYLSFGIKCSKCGRQGHRRASCPSLARRNFDAPKRVDSPAQIQASSPSPTVPQRTGPPSPVPSPPAPLAPSEEAPNNAPVTPAAAAPGAPALHPARPPLPPGEAPSSTCSASDPPTTPALPPPVPAEPMEVAQLEEEGTGSTQEGKNKIRKELDACLRPAPSTIFDKTNQAGLEKERVCSLLVSTPHLKKQLPDLTPAQRTALYELVQALLRPAPAPSRDFIIGFTIASINARGLAIRNKSLSLCHLLRQHRVDIALVQETNTHHLDGAQDLCLGYDVITAPPDAISGSGLACIYAPGVTVSRHRILWPGHIVLATFNVHGQEMTVINVHLSHDQRERIEQLRVIEAAAVEEEEEAWVLGDFNIRDDRNRDSISMAALGALCESAALLDAAPEFDAAHLPTRVAAHGDLIESSRLDRILAPARFLEVSTSYAIAPFHLSDHRMVLLRVGPPAAPSQPRVAATLRSGLAQEHMNNYLVDIAEEISLLDAPQLWDRWTLIKAGILAEARSLHDPRHHDRDDGYIGRAQRYIRVQVEASSTNADYPSLPDLARLTRHRRPAVTTIRDENGEVIEGAVLRRKALDIFRPRFARPSCDPAEYAAFIGATTTTPIELGEEDPLHRAEVSEAEVAAAIRRLPRGRAPGWDGLPCEVLSTFEEFFAVALRRVLAESQLRGALPPSMRRSEICLVPKARDGGRGLDSYRPISLPSADYRVIGSILLGRLRPHLSTLVPECQTYAVPGRSPSWNIARVTDAVEEATARGTPLAAVSVDLQSAFDSLDRGYLTSLLVSHLRLPPAFVGWTLLLYAGADATIKVGGFQTVAFKLLNGVRQGCALSAALFSIATGPLLRRLETILGVGNVIAYADDIVLLFHRDEEFERVATVLGDFKRASGIAVNLGKSAGLWCGAWRNRGDSPLGASWSTTSIRVLGLDIAPRSSVAHQEQHLLALLESACRRWTPFTRGLSLVGRARAANSLVGSTIQHHLHGYLPSPTTIAKLQARLARFVWGPERTAWLPAAVMARPVAIGGLGLLDLATQLQLACLKGVQVALRGGRNGFSWLVTSEAGLRPPPDGTTLQPRRLRLLKLWEEASNILGLNHRAVPTAQLLDLPIIGGCRFLRPPDLLAPARWSGARVRDLIEEEHLIARPTRSALADAATLGAFCRRLTSENALRLWCCAGRPRRSSTASRRARPDGPWIVHASRPRRSPDSWRDGHPPSRIDWASLRRCAFSGHEADAAFKLALHALPHPAHPASAVPSCPACGSVDRSLGHRYWSCSSIRPLIREAFNIIGRPPDLQAWIFGGSGFEDDALTILASAKLRVYRHFVQVGLGGVEDPLIAWTRTLVRRGCLPSSSIITL
ncbi:hypothetical protein LAZ67_X000976 [Cordylochernes scorpioides]|uniref:Reverse transcriptase n=1 Tax=Cordylochernes scorpioides TaxID=51811 RepID=A0ABY6LSC0_9ARAC|nr:hypothetical protein LAZ67_X000976 [Cordylochernes scorpioides]